MNTTKYIYHKEYMSSCYAHSKEPLTITAQNYIIKYMNAENFT